MLDEGNNPTLETPEAPPPPEESSNRTFLIVGGIFAILIFLTLVCGAVYALWYLPSQTASQKATQAAILSGNAQVVAQMTSTAQAALWTPTSLPTNTPLNDQTAVAAQSTSTVQAPLLTPTSLPTNTPLNSQTAVAIQATSTAQAALATPTSLLPNAPTNTAVAAINPINSPTAMLATSLATLALAPVTGPAAMPTVQAAQATQQMASTEIMLGTPIGSAMPKTGFFDQVGLPGLVILALVLIAVIFLARRLRHAPSK